ncbi:MAG: hypothetical protein ACRDIY_08915, partial [Chloroflexota bacterium]
TGLAVALRLDGLVGLAASVLSVLLTALGEVIVGPIVIVCWVLTYYDLRIRKEGFDLQLEAEAISTAEGLQGG